MIMDLTAYHPALLALAILCVAVLIQNVLTGFFAFTKKGGQTPGMIKGGPEDFSYRVLRTYGNSVESLPAFAIIVFLAIVAGVSPKWVNLLAGIYVAIRLCFWAVYYHKIGARTPGIRSPLYGLGWLVNMILAVMTVSAFI